MPVNIQIISCIKWRSWSFRSMLSQHQQHLKVAVPSTNYSQAVLRGEDPVLEEENTVTWPTGWRVPSGNLRLCYEKWPILLMICLLKIVTFESCVKLPEGMFRFLGPDDNFWGFEACWSRYLALVACASSVIVADKFALPIFSNTFLVDVSTL